jgi:hypothetical protein
MSNRRDFITLLGGAAARGSRAAGGAGDRIPQHAIARAGALVSTQPVGARL